MKVVIVAKTRMGSAACIGALTFDGCSLRLFPENIWKNEHYNLEYQIGEVWEVDGYPSPEIIPPHVEDYIVKKKCKLGVISSLRNFINQQMSPLKGGIEMVHGGLVQASDLGVLYVSKQTGIPDISTMFWKPDKTLIRDTNAKRIRYRYPGNDRDCSLTYVGFQEPPSEIPAGTILRVSLAHWWRPAERPEQEKRCYVQISGWITNENKNVTKTSAMAPHRTYKRSLPRSSTALD